MSKTYTVRRRTEFFSGCTGFKFVGSKTKWSNVPADDARAAAATGRYEIVTEPQKEDQ